MSHRSFIQNSIRRIESLSKTDPEAAFSEETKLVWTIVQEIAKGTIPGRLAQETCIQLQTVQAIQFPRYKA